MTSLYVDRRGVELKLDGEALAFYENKERVGTVPLAPLERIFLRGDVTLHSSLLGKLGEKGIGLVVLTGRKASASLMLARPHNDAARRVEQYRLSQDTAFCLRTAQSLVAAKLDEAERFLTSLQESGRHAARLELDKSSRLIGRFAGHITQQISLAALRGLEGRAAAAYFSGLAAYLPASLRFTGRNRRPPRDPLNVLLSLSYTLLHADIVIALYGSGLDPFVGFYHGLDFGRESLASDLMEPLRPIVDRFAVSLLTSGQIRVENFSDTPDGCLLGKAGRTRFYPLYEEAAEHFRKQVAHSVSDMVALLKPGGAENTGRSAPRFL
ncbi:MAG: CRISPR-associated endonuclease Cas1 [Desulfovibrio sp.]|jgi:CRISPR-associated protein Cas1|nr:CRISPR-associated endonuclease Cas1 [Desulfovibrio sp.]